MNLVRSMAIEWAPAIRVNAVAPGAVATLRAMEMARAKGIEGTTFERVAMRRMGSTDEMAKAGLFLLSDLAKEVSGQILASRMHEIYLFNQTRPIRSVHRAEGWTPQTIAEHALPAIRTSLTPLDRSGDVFSWDPI